MDIIICVCACCSRLSLRIALNFFVFFFCWIVFLSFLFLVISSLVHICILSVCLLCFCGWLVWVFFYAWPGLACWWCVVTLCYYIFHYCIIFLHLVFYLAWCVHLYYFSLFFATKETPFWYFSAGLISILEFPIIRAAVSCMNFFVFVLSSIWKRERMYPVSNSFIKLVIFQSQLW